MLDFIGTAWAQGGEQATGAGGELMRFLPLLLIFIVFYFLLLRPQQKKLDALADMIKNLKKGDKVVTAGGIVGTIVKMDGDDHVMVEIANGVQVKVVRSTINGLFEQKQTKE